MGNRISKLVIPKNGSGQQEPTNKWVTTYYVRDAQVELPTIKNKISETRNVAKRNFGGNVMATYERNYNTQSGLSEINLEEQNIYGSSRLGVVNRNANMATLPVPSTQTVLTRELGNINYELSNHLGNVLAVISDRKLAYSSNQTTVDYYLADVVSATDYFAFGSPMPARQFNSASYKYGFNGKENDNEVKGAGNSLDFGARIYDSRIAVWLSRDPQAHLYPDISPYVAFGNNPIIFVDPGGETLNVFNTSKEAIDQFNSQIRKSFNNQISITVTNGSINIHAITPEIINGKNVVKQFTVANRQKLINSLTQNNQITADQLVFLNTILDVVLDKQVTNIRLLATDEKEADKYFIGGYEDKTFDLGDMEALGFEQNGLPSFQSTFTHELIEQFKLQDKNFWAGKNEDDRYAYAHQEANIAEGKVGKYEVIKEYDQDILTVGKDKFIDITKKISNKSGIIENTIYSKNGKVYSQQQK